MNLFQIGVNNWVFYDYHRLPSGLWKVYFTKHVHGVSIEKYDGILGGLESIRTDTKEELSDIVEQIIYQIINKII